jgi:hypothetical protein
MMLEEARRPRRILESRGDIAVFLNPLPQVYLLSPTRPYHIKSPEQKMSNKTRDKSKKYVYHIMSSLCSF